MQPSTDRRGVVGVVGPVAQLSKRQRGGQVHLGHGLHHEIRHGVHHVEILCSRRQHLGRDHVAAALCPER